MNENENYQKKNEIKENVKMTTFSYRSDISTKFTCF